MGYTAKYASAFYGPFRSAAESGAREGDRRTYQMDPANGREALLEADLDAAEGADILMVKPALPCLDVVAALKRRVDRPVAAYQVSGEYAMLIAAIERGWLDRSAIFETILSIKRAGSDMIISYFTSEILSVMKARG
jgi:porphobilinogen synthase